MAQKLMSGPGLLIDYGKADRFGAPVVDAGEITVWASGHWTVAHPVEGGVTRTASYLPNRNLAALPMPLIGLS